MMANAGSQQQRGKRGSGSTPSAARAHTRLLRHVCSHLLARPLPGHNAAAAVEGDGDGTAEQFEVVELCEADIPACAAVASAAYSKGGVPTQQETQQRIERWQRLMGITARQWGHRTVGGGGKLVSCVAMYWARGEGGRGGHARVTGMVVHPAHRRHGLGAQLMLVLMASARAMGVTLSLCATPMGRPLYASLGFTVRDEYSFHTLPAAAERTVALDSAALASAAGATATVVTSPLGAADVAQLAALDSAAFGGDRASILEAAFVGGAGVLVLMHAARGSGGGGGSPGRLLGYLHCSDSGWGRRVGPVVAACPPVALAAFAALADCEFGRESRLRMLVRASQREFTRGLLSMGTRQRLDEDDASKPVRLTPGMVMDDKPFPGQRDLYFALGDMSSG
jgi:GNAT superfamily N-acetyltransferase